MSDGRSFWDRLYELLSRLNPLSILTDSTDPLKTTAFTIGVIALSAKIAKVDGRVDVIEVATFREIFRIDPEDEKRVGDVYNLLKQDSSNFEAYARQLRRLLSADPEALVDVLDALFAIAMADGLFHAEEEAFLKSCAKLFEVSGESYDRLMSRWVPEHWNAHAVLGTSKSSSPEFVRQRYKALVRQTHPDTLIGRGMPAELVGLATRRLEDINRAYAEISVEIGLR